MVLSRIRWQIALPFVFLFLATTLGVTLYISSWTRTLLQDALKTRLLTNAQLMRDSIERQGLNAPNELARRWSALLGMRVTIIAPDGVVLGESHANRLPMDNHLYRPEVQQALYQGHGVSVRFSDTVHSRMIYVAVPIGPSDQFRGIVRVALPLRQIEQDVGQIRRTTLTLGLAMTLVAAFLALLCVARITRPISHLRWAMEQAAGGNLDVHVIPYSQDEIGQLTHAFNRMSRQLREQLTSLTRERVRLGAILEHMADGVVITDQEGTIELINPSAGRFLGTDEQKALHSPLSQISPHLQVLDLWRRARETGREQSRVIEIEPAGVFWQVIVTPFREAGVSSFLIILQDLTRIRRLESVRRTFLSNISHELRTPLAGLKALVETLSEGALEDPPAARRFLSRMETEVDAMHQMVQELLELSRIESGQMPLHPVPIGVDALLLPTIERLSVQAERAGLTLRLELPETLPRVYADAERIGQVVTNLLHNAIKFTPSGGEVTVAARQEGKEVIIVVKDTGRGIPAEHLDRIFERFYKVEQARSGSGTGLGLAIARHIVQHHGGRIWAESVEGKGSAFYFSLPVTS